jgi:hypothetical protein
MKILILLVLFSAVVLCQVRPKVPEIFVAQVAVRFDSAQYRVAGEGAWAANQPNGTAVEHYRFDQSHITEYLLQRYDLGVDYRVENETRCFKYTVEGRLPPYWDWVANATYTGRRVIERQTLDFWDYKTGYSSLSLGVLASDSNHPVQYIRINAQRNSTFYFSQFNARTPSSFYFNVPEECRVANPTIPVISDDNQVAIPETRCETRANIIARAQVWVANKVPYNQGATYQGYREDCSGYVSMAWALSKPGYVTQTLGQVSKRITKDELLEGDILLYAAEHVVIFGGWTNSAKSEYVAYEETKPGEGTVKRATPYPYWYDTASFLPYRFNSVC